jgi:uncharacterized protein YdiU (UPF0061 family)
MKEHHTDYTLTFRLLPQALEKESESSALKAMFSHSPIFDQWLLLWKKRLKSETLNYKNVVHQMNCVNPCYIPRNHLIEKTIQSAVTNNDFSDMKELITVLSHPYDEKPEYEIFARPALPHERVYQTFCGT